MPKDRRAFRANLQRNRDQYRTVAVTVRSALSGEIVFGPEHFERGTLAQHIAQQVLGGKEPEGCVKLLCEKDEVQLCTCIGNLASEGTLNLSAVFTEPNVTFEFKFSSHLRGYSFKLHIKPGTTFDETHLQGQTGPEMNVHDEDIFAVLEREFGPLGEFVQELVNKRPTEAERLEMLRKEASDILYFHFTIPGRIRGVCAESSGIEALAAGHCWTFLHVPFMRKYQGGDSDDSDFLVPDTDTDGSAKGRDVREREREREVSDDDW